MGSTKARVGVVLVSYGHDKDIKALIRSLKKQLLKGDRIALVNNMPGTGLGEGVKVNFYTELNNPGYAQAVNTAVDAIIDTVDVIFMLNPDTKISTNLLDVIRNGWNKGFAAWMPLLTLSDGKVNSAGNIVHISGLSWCDGYLSDVSQHKKIKEVDNISGACMAIGVDWWRKIDGIPEGYFMYYEDPEMSTRIKMLGGKIALLPEAYVEHEYSEEGGRHKRYHLERNRHLFIIRNWPIGVIALTLPILILTELGLWAVALLQNKITAKAGSAVGMIKLLPWAIKGRRSFRPSGRLSTHAYLKTLQAELDSPMLAMVDRPVTRAILAGYYKCILKIASLVK